MKVIQRTTLALTILLAAQAALTGGGPAGYVVVYNPTDPRSVTVANPSGDGIPNLMKYALGLNPLTVATSGLPTFFLDSNVFTYSFTRLRDASDITGTSSGFFKLRITKP